MEKWKRISNLGIIAIVLICVLSFHGKANGHEPYTEVWESYSEVLNNGFEVTVELRNSFVRHKINGKHLIVIIQSKEFYYSLSQTRASSYLQKTHIDVRAVFNCWDNQGYTVKRMSDYCQDTGGTLSFYMRKYKIKKIASDSAKIDSIMKDALSGSGYGEILDVQGFK